jgi:ATP-dependent RNA helicase DDX23/PRP28
MNNQQYKMTEGAPPLIDPVLLQGLSEEERQEALAAAAAAKRAEERAEQRALERALQQKEEARQRERQYEQERRLAEMQQRNKAALQNAGGGGITSTASVSSLLSSSSAAPTTNNGSGGGGRLVFVPKSKRVRNGDHAASADGTATVSTAVDLTVKPVALQLKPPPSTQAQTNHSNRVFPPSATTSRATTSTSAAVALPTGWSERELAAVKESYLGKSASEKDEEQISKRKKQRTNKKMTFKFKWEASDDTFDDNDPLYAISAIPMAATASANSSSRNPHHPYAQARAGASARDDRIGRNEQFSHHRRGPGGGGDNVYTKPLSKMTARDWRILRENHEITVKGGKAPPPMRTFRESPSPELPQLHPVLLDAIENVLRYKDPSPIQRQAIPIGLQRRDLIGIAETGSGKTIAFGVPLCHYLLHLSSTILQSVADDGPLALILAPTRELALQIDGELQKLLGRQRIIKTFAVVGGQSIQNQAQMIRKGIHILVGTPGRVNDCIEMAYLVLNQCCYIVLDECDRMLDMGFAPQVESILNAMGGTMKSEIEQETYQQEMEDLVNGGGTVARHRLTAMFSATMLPEVEKLARQYLRHPAVVHIGGQGDKAKNTRITQNVIFLGSASLKEKALREQLQDPRFLREKVIVFVNEKKHADQVGRIVERSGRTCVVLHGGKTQEQREENLETFRQGGVVMVATDVAGRGLDIPDVAHVINYDLPTRSIEGYQHRIGRTGRAGKSGYATSFITDEDEGIMPALKAYLESTGNVVPDRLARHPAAAGGVMNNLIY